jgi:transcriptional regulator with XRE-family HTH domain
MDENLQPRLGVVLRRARMRLGLTQEQVAREVGFVTTVYGRIERGDMLPSVPKLCRLCITLSISANELLSLSRPAGAPVPGPAGSTSDDPPELRRVAMLLRGLPQDKLRVFRALVDALLAVKQG